MSQNQYRLDYGFLTNSKKKNKTTVSNENNHSDTNNPINKCNQIRINNDSKYTIKYTSKPRTQDKVTHDETEAGISAGIAGLKGGGNIKHVQDTERGDALQPERGYIQSGKNQIIDIGQCESTNISYYYYIYDNQPDKEEENRNYFVGHESVVITDPIPEREKYINKIKIDYYNEEIDSYTEKIESYEKKIKLIEDKNNKSQQTTSEELAGIQEEKTNTEKEEKELSEKIQQLKNEHNKVLKKLGEITGKHDSLKSTKESEDNEEKLQLEELRKTIEKSKKKKRELQHFINELL